MRFGLALTVLVACSDGYDVVELGEIQRIEMPESTAIGVPFVVRAVTQGDLCVSFERTDVELFADRAEVWAYDRRHVPGDDEACPQLLVLIPHDATLQFDHAGTMTVVFHGSIRHGSIRDELRLPRALIVE
jgi:hypothetical protein